MWTTAYVKHCSSKEASITLLAHGINVGASVLDVSSSRLIIGRCDGTLEEYCGSVNGMHCEGQFFRQQEEFIERKTAQTLREYAPQIIELYQTLHDNGIIHGFCDGKNIIIDTKNSTVRLFDFSRSEFLHKLDYEAYAYKVFYASATTAKELMNLEMERVKAFLNYLQ